MQLKICASFVLQNAFTCRVIHGLPLCPGPSCPHCCLNWQVISENSDHCVVVLVDIHIRMIITLADVLHCWVEVASCPGSLHCIKNMCFVATRFMCRVIHGPTSLCCKRATPVPLAGACGGGGCTVMLLLLVEIHCSLLLLSPLPAGL